VVIVSIELHSEHYDSLLQCCDEQSFEYWVLQNSIVPGQTPLLMRRKIKIMCEREQATKLLGAALRLYPKAADAIAVGIGTANKL
jgi:hypothetical protein